MLQPLTTILSETAPVEPQRARIAAGGPVPERVGARPAAGARNGRLPRLLNIPAWPAPVTAAVCALLLLVISLMDFYTGPEVQLTPGYFLPIILASVRFQA